MVNDEFSTQPFHKILIVDDNQADRHLLRYYLENNHNGQFQCLEASKAEEALELTELEKPDCILLDYRLPGMSGLDCLQELRQYNNQSAVIMISAIDNQEIVISALKNGAQDYLPKDRLDEKELIEKITHAIQQAKIFSNHSQTFINKDITEALIKELKEPLKGFIIGIGVTQKRIQEKNETAAQEYLKVLQAGAINMYDFMDKLSIYSYIQAQAPIENLSFKEVVDQVLESLQERIKRKQAQIEIQALPRIMGNLTLLTHALRFIVINCLKYFEKSLSIEIKCKYYSNMATITVSAEGEPLKNTHYLTELLGIQNSLPSTKNPLWGTGMQLTRMIIERHGGELWEYTDAPNKYVVQFTLPVVSA